MHDRSARDAPVFRRVWRVDRCPSTPSRTSPSGSGPAPCPASRLPLLPALKAWRPAASSRAGPRGVDPGRAHAPPGLRPAAASKPGVVWRSTRSPHSHWLWAATQGLGSRRSTDFSCLNGWPGSSPSPGGPRSSQSRVDNAASPGSQEQRRGPRRNRRSSGTGRSGPRSRHAGSPGRPSRANGGPPPKGGGRRPTVTARSATHSKGRPGSTGRSVRRPGAGTAVRERRTRSFPGTDPDRAAPRWSRRARRSQNRTPWGFPRRPSRYSLASGQGAGYRADASTPMPAPLGGPGAGRARP